MNSFRRLVTCRTSFSVRKTVSSCCLRTRKFSTVSDDKFCSGQEKSSFTPFDKLLNQRRDEASKSVVIQVKNDQSYGQLYNYLKKYGSVKNSFFYSLSPENNYILIEFEQQESVEAALTDGQYLNPNEVFPTRSPFLWFRLDARSKTKCPSAPILKHERVTDLSSTEIQDVLRDSKSFSEDMTVLYNSVRLNELGSRLRFLTAYQVETAFKGLFPFCSALPFGSSINGFGKVNCDLDLVLTYDSRLKQAVVPNRLIHHTKPSTSTSRMYTQRDLEIVADILQYFLPGCNQVRRILQARVPILKFKQDITGIDCDLSSIKNMSGVYMSELLYIFSSYDWRVCPLVYTVRYWAKETALTNPAPGRWITNFSLTLLVLFYLQYEKIIPTIKTLVNHKRPDDARMINDVDCSFLRDIRLLPEGCTVEKNSSLVELLFGFFRFYSSFDFGSYAISLYTGSMISKPEYSSLYIVNPLEKHLNVTQNVSQEECARIKMQFTAAAWSMECSISEQSDSKKWGLVDLVNSHVLGINTSIRTQGSMKTTTKLTVQQLFEDDDKIVTRKEPRKKNKKQPV